MFNIGFGELVLIGVLALIFIGPQQLPELAKALGKLIGDLKRASDEITGTVTGIQNQARGYLEKTENEIRRGVSPDDARKDPGFIKPPEEIPGQMSLDLNTSTLDDAHRNNPHMVLETDDMDRFGNRKKKAWEVAAEAVAQESEKTKDATKSDGGEGKT